MRKRNETAAQRGAVTRDDARVLYVVRMRNTPAGKSDDWATLVKAGRLKQRMSQQALADAVGVARETVWRWETGRQKPENAEIVAKVAAAIDEDVNVMLRAAKLAVSNEEPARDPRLHGLDPHDEVVRRVLTGPLDREVQDMILDRLRIRRAQELAARRERELEEIAQAEEIWRRSAGGTA